MEKAYINAPKPIYYMFSIIEEFDGLPLLFIGADCPREELNIGSEIYLCKSDINYEAKTQHVLICATSLWTIGELINREISIGAALDKFPNLDKYIVRLISNGKDTISREGKFESEEYLKSAYVGYLVNDALGGYELFKLDVVNGKYYH